MLTMILFSTCLILIMSNMHDMHFIVLYAAFLS